MNKLYLVILLSILSSCGTKERFWYPIEHFYVKCPDYAEQVYMLGYSYQSSFVSPKYVEKDTHSEVIFVNTSCIFVTVKKLPRLYVMTIAELNEEQLEYMVKYER